MRSFGLAGRVLLFAGIFLVLLGLVLVYAPGIPFLGRLPGDIFFQKGNLSFFFPIVTSLVFSLIITILINVIIWLLRR
ncbi:MAG: DUF2905 domain-containing protein [Chloroflexi bacterium]|nr:DUF2905 domain-containing protein [Chloroflexota bacterium]